MRCDWPAGYNEDCTEPPCEIFLQLFIENPDIGVGDIVLGDEDIAPLIQFAPALNDVDSEHGDDFPVDYHVDDASSDLISVNSDLSMNIVSVTSDSFSESSDSDVETHEDLSGIEPQYEEISDAECIASVISDTASEVSVCLAESHEVLSATELHCKETSSKLSDEETSRDTWLPDENFPVVGDLPEDYSDVFLELDCSPLTSPSPENFEEASSNVPYEGSDNCDAIPPLSSELPNEGELPQELETSSGDSSASTYVSLFVVVPPTNFSNEGSDNLLPAHSSDNLFTELLPIDAPNSSESFQSGKENVLSDDSHICSCNGDVIALSESSACNATSTKSNQSSNNLLVPHIAAIKTDCPVSESVSENNLCGELDFGSSVSDSSHCQNNSLFLENEACSEILTGKSVINKKRKVSTSSDDTIINKVPKYSSETSTDSTNVHESVDSYRKVLSCNSDRQTTNDEDGADILPPAVPGDNVILTLGKAVEESSVVNEKPKSR